MSAFLIAVKKIICSLSNNPSLTPYAKAYTMNPTALVSGKSASYSNLLYYSIWMHNKGIQSNNIIPILNQADKLPLLKDKKGT